MTDQTTPDTSKPDSKRIVLQRLVRRVRFLSHRISHLLGMNCGRVETWAAKNGRIMVGFRCECGELSGIHPIPDRYNARAHQSFYP